MSNSERLVYMANQIARNLEALGHDQAVVATADHIVHFWDPRMRANILAHMHAGGQGLVATAAEALAIVATKGPATKICAIESGGAADAG